jgi:hypothetical protein
LDPGKYWICIQGTNGSFGWQSSYPDENDFPVMRGGDVGPWYFVTNSGHDRVNQAFTLSGTGTASVPESGSTLLFLGMAFVPVGTWIFDAAKSKLSPLRGPIVKEAVLVIEIGTTDHESYSKETYTDGSSALSKWTLPRQGGMVKCQQGCAPDTVFVVTRISGGEDYWTGMRDGKQFEVGHWTVSKDGKEIRGVIKGTNAQGKSYEELRVGHRQ